MRGWFESLDCWRFYFQFNEIIAKAVDARTAFDCRFIAISIFVSFKDFCFDLKLINWWLRDWMEFKVELKVTIDCAEFWDVWQLWHRWMGRMSPMRTRLYSTPVPLIQKHKLLVFIQHPVRYPKSHLEVCRIVNEGNRYISLKFNGNFVPVWGTKLRTLERRVGGFHNENKRLTKDPPSNELSFWTSKWIHN